MFNNSTATLQEGAEFELKSTDVFLCGHGQNGNGEVKFTLSYLIIIVILNL